jgi:hypothetical protein
MGLGGKRAGAGRKPVHDEMKARDLCQTAIINKFGTLEDGLQFLLESNEPTLMKFVFEHAIGKPTDKIENVNEKFVLIERDPDPTNEPIH